VLLDPDHAFKIYSTLNTFPPKPLDDREDDIALYENKPVHLVTIQNEF
jgi:hypothetical protein